MSECAPPTPHAQVKSPTACNAHHTIRKSAKFVVLGYTPVNGQCTSAAPTCARAPVSICGLFRRAMRNRNVACGTGVDPNCAQCIPYNTYSQYCVACNPGYSLGEYGQCISACACGLVCVYVCVCVCLYVRVFVRACVRVHLCLFACDFVWFPARIWLVLASVAVSICLCAYGMCVCD